MFCALRGIWLSLWGSPLLKFWCFWWSFFSRRNERILWGKSLLHFSQLMIRKIQVFQHAPMCICPVICKYAIGGKMCSPRAKKVNHLYCDQLTIWELFTKIWNHHLPSGWLQYLSHVRNQQTFGKTNMSSEFFVSKKSIYVYCICNSRLNSKAKQFHLFPQLSP